MAQFSYAKALLEHWGVTVEDIPVSPEQGKQEADFLATFSGVKVLIEEKLKLDDPAYLARRAETLDAGGIDMATLPLRRDETLSNLVRNASHQLRSSAQDRDHSFRLMWFTATGYQAEAKFEQLIATLYGTTQITELNSSVYRRCYHFRHADFFRRADVIDGAVVSHFDGKTITAKLCLNELSPRFEALLASPVLRPFGTAVENPIANEADGTAFILDADLDRKQQQPLLTYLQRKYGTGPLMPFDLGYTSAAILVDGRGAP